MKLVETQQQAWFLWAADGRSLLYTKNEGGVDNIWNQPIFGGTPKQVTHFNSEQIGVSTCHETANGSLCVVAGHKKTWC